MHHQIAAQRLIRTVPDIARKRIDADSVNAICSNERWLIRLCNRIVSQKMVLPSCGRPQYAISVDQHTVRAIAGEFGHMSTGGGVQFFILPIVVAPLPK